MENKMKESKTILVADDDVQLVDSVKTLLESDGFTVVYTYNCDHVVEFAKEIKPDLILLDVLFAAGSGADGFEISRRIRKEKELEGIPVVILSGVKRIMQFDSKLEPDDDWMPVNAFLNKPIKPATLLNEIKKHLN
jgi:two-component system, OmpR family, alkaline phosphatase synthesis response regulator PhoP